VKLSRQIRTHAFEENTFASLYTEFGQKRTSLSLFYTHPSSNLLGKVPKRRRSRVSRSSLVRREKAISLYLYTLNECWCSESWLSLHKCTAQAQSPFSPSTLSSTYMNVCVWLLQSIHRYTQYVYIYIDVCQRCFILPDLDKYTQKTPNGFSTSYLYCHFPCNGTKKEFLVQILFIA